MLILLPPSETKRPGGTRRPLRIDDLALPVLTPQRERVVAALEKLSADPTAAARVLKLGASQQGEVAVNARIRSSPALPAVDRYTGVLYEALDAVQLDPAARRWLGAHVLIHSAPFGPVAALDRIPAYRLAAGAALPGLPSLRSVWADAVTAALADRAPAFVLDLRSEAYVSLGPVPLDVPSVYLRVVSEGADGAVRALNHFNKQTKGSFVRALAQQRPRLASLRGVRRWADAAGWALRDSARGMPGEWDLLVPG